MGINDEFKRIATFAKTLYKESRKFESYSKDNKIDAACINNIGYCAFNNLTPVRFIHSQTLINGTHEASEGNTVRAIALPSYEDSQKYCAVVEVFGAINSQSQDKEAAYRLLKTAMSTPGYLSSDEYTHTLGSMISANVSVSNAITDTTLMDSPYTYMNLDNQVKVPFAKLKTEDGDYGYINGLPDRLGADTLVWLNSENSFRVLLVLYLWRNCAFCVFYM